MPSPINLILGKKKIQGLQHSLVSAQKISNASMNIFNELHSHASKVMTLIEENQIEKSNQLVNFEKTFKVAKAKLPIEVFHCSLSIFNPLNFMKQEQAEKEEKQALANIAAIIANLTSKRAEMVGQCSSISLAYFLKTRMKSYVS